METVEKKRVRRMWKPLERDILRTLLYFDVFGHPLTLDELQHFLPADQVTGVEAALSRARLREVISTDQGFLRMANRPSSIGAERLVKELRARSYWKAARIVAALLRRMPFIRAVGLSGELSKGVASPNTDIDLFIVTAQRRVWIVRTLLTAVKKLFLFNKRRFFCINYLVAEDHLTVDDRNICSALEIVTLRPLGGEAVHLAYLHANAWVAEYFPNAYRRQTLALREGRERRPWTQRVVEFLLPRGMGDRLEQHLFHFWKRVWDHRYAHLSAADRTKQFRTTPYLSTAYGEDHFAIILERYAARLRVYGCNGATSSPRQS